MSRSAAVQTSTTSTLPTPPETTTSTTRKATWTRTWSKSFKHRLDKHRLDTITQQYLPAFQDDVNPQTEFTIAPVNTRSLTHRVKDIERDPVLTKADVLCLTETWNAPKPSIKGDSVYGEGRAARRWCRDLRQAPTHRNGSRSTTNNSKPQRRARRLYTTQTTTTTSS